MSNDIKALDVRPFRILIWSAIWSILIAPLGMLYGDGIGIGLGTPVSVGIISMPLLVLAIFLAIRSEPSSVIKVIQNPSVIMAFPLGILMSYLVFAIYLILLIPVRTRYFLLKLFDYPHIESLLWGALSIYLNYGTTGVIFPVIFFPGSIAKIIMDKLWDFISFESAFSGFFFDFTENALSILIAYMVLKNLSALVSLRSNKESELEN